ncbi:MBL fold metallo-hydrolase [Mameliella sediminis]|uniref:MBL fold metallo-hydrolase n=1 Tax=Mameliella sediminis TaxID=2836866 RepID=UPI001C46DC10|nr:MBL fold metallo-hydrolase [Mameliella sediminis]MBV7395582.1 MBL fold metallo-hydrolase [Mameliella sediminis]MBY6163932.1 MBL fold metallo-hydrolase [Mameliella alba]MBY6172405.1 MBL fold metallo-hydrolase [Mameliella alba]MBY6177419.1 MBL fold metallo-hydrolase [Mameliella alba]
MTLNRRTFLSTAAAAGTITVLPFAGRAGGHLPNEFKTSQGTLLVHPVHHASIVMETPIGTLYVDPVGETSEYEGLPPADLILVTHQHGDHYNADVLKAVKGENTQMITNPAVFDMLPEELKMNTSAMGNGATASLTGLQVDAIPAHNITEGRLNFHPKGRDNGYVLTMDDFRVYVSGDTEDVPEMRALEGIDLAFVCMNLPFTMTAEAAADAVRTFKPTFVYPYHYRGRDGGTQDPAMFAEMVGDASTVKMGDWYKPGELG